MKGSLDLGKIAGIKLSIHWTFIFILVYVFIVYYQMEQDPAQGFMGVLLVLALFVCVVLHELGHALTGRKFGITTRSITLLPIGGMARMEKFPQKPKQEVLVAIAGPLVNIAIAGLLYLVLYLFDSIPRLEGQQDLADLSGPVFWYSLLVINVIIAVFNFIPAFPMDGGRILRGLLLYRYDREKATQIAAGIGQFLAVVFFISGFFINLWLIFIGIFVFLGARAESEFEVTKAVLSGYKVRDVMMKKYAVLKPDDSLDTAVKTLLDGQAQEFVITEGDEVKGILSRNEIIDALSKGGKDTKVSEAMRTDFMTLDPDAELDKQFRKIMQSDSPIAPVLEDGEFLGIVDKDNIQEFIMVKKATAE